MIIKKIFTSLIHGNTWRMTCWEIKAAISNLFTDLTVRDYFLLQQPGDTHKRRACVSTSPPDVFCPCSPLAWLPAYLLAPSHLRQSLRSFLPLLLHLLAHPFSTWTNTGNFHSANCQNIYWFLCLSRATQPGNWSWMHQKISKERL